MHENAILYAVSWLRPSDLADSHSNGTPLSVRLSQKKIPLKFAAPLFIHCIHLPPTPKHYTTMIPRFASPLLFGTRTRAALTQRAVSTFNSSHVRMSIESGRHTPLSRPLIRSMLVGASLVGAVLAGSAQAASCESSFSFKKRSATNTSTQKRAEGTHAAECKKRLCGKVVLITGATGGIGEACAKKFADEGCRLILVGRCVCV